MIHKQVPEGQRYTQISNDVLQSDHLSLLAKGLLAVLLSHPPNFKVTADWIHRHCDEGRLRVRKVLAELQEAGYLEKRSERNDKGHVIEWIWDVNQGDKMIRTIDEITEPKSPDVQKVVSGQVGPGVQKCTSGQVTPINEKQTNKEKVNQKEKVAVAKSSRRQIEYTTAFESFWKLYRDHCYPTAGDKEQAFPAFQRCLQEGLTADQIEQSAVNYCLAQRQRNLDTRHAERFLKQADFVRDFLEAKPLQSEAATSRYQSADEKNQALLDNFLKEDTNGKQGNDSPSADRVFSQHRKNDTKRAALSLVAAVQRRTG